MRNKRKNKCNKHHQKQKQHHRQNRERADCIIQMLLYKLMKLNISFFQSIQHIFAYLVPCIRCSTKSYFLLISFILLLSLLFGHTSSNKPNSVKLLGNAHHISLHANQKIAVIFISQNNVKFGSIKAK